jgi:hypothetical protein
LPKQISGDHKVKPHQTDSADVILQQPCKPSMGSLTLHCLVYPPEAGWCRMRPRVVHIVS